jgi:Mg2+-importing ATPase
MFVTQATLTGESLPVEKNDTRENQTGRAPLELLNVCFLGTSVESGTGTGVVVETGLKTYLGSMSWSIARQQVQTSFDKGVSRFTWLMIRFMLVMVPLVFIINGLTKHNWQVAFFFAMAVAVGLTPEMLPMIVTVCLSKGAMIMSRKKVIIKRLNSIQNLGAMDVLCADKTGTLTMDRIILEMHCDVARQEDESILTLAYLNSYFQTGLKNVLDRAVLRHKEVHELLQIPDYQKIDEIPFDFSRRIMSVVVRTPEDVYQIICKGAPEEVFKRCTRFELDGEINPMDQLLIDELKMEYQSLSEDGFRVLALAYKNLDVKSTYSRLDESDLILRGYIAFLDPPKETAEPALKMMQKHGVSVKILTGDNELVAQKICREVGLSIDRPLLGSQVEEMSDAQLADEAEKTVLFARLSPAHKQRIIKALQSKNHVVGFLGDGINDAPALRAADVGISVDTAVDIARASADVILLEKSLLVLDEGVQEGRKVFANILKYIRMGASSNFGNMFSVLGGSIFLPFVPMAPIQILTNNLLYDFSQVPIPTDEVDPEQIAKPRPWSISEIARFVLFIGPCSSVFDYTTFLIMLIVFKCWDPAFAPLFQTGWFVESLLTQTLIIHIIRTNRIPFIQTRASWPVILTTAIIMLVGVWLPFSPIAGLLGFVALPPLYWPLLILTLVCYTLLTQGVKMYLLKKAWI